MLNALGVDQLVLAELQHLPVVKPDRQGADEKQSAQNEPKNTHPPGAHTFPGGLEVDGHGHLDRHRLATNFKGFQARHWRLRRAASRTCNWNLGTRGILQRSAIGCQEDRTNTVFDFGRASYFP